LYKEKIRTFGEKPDMFKKEFYGGEIVRRLEMDYPWIAKTEKH
jgi:hypothetical protein